MKRFFSYIFILIGISALSLTGYMVWQRNSPTRLAFNIQSYPKSETIVVKRQPRRVVLKKVGIDLPVIPASLTNGKWDATLDGVSYLQTSVIPGEEGNSILYGHNWRNLLGNLTNARPGQEILIEYDDKSKAVFTIEYTAEVSPNETHILNPSEDKRITLYTCSGFLDSKRFVVVALLDDGKTEKLTAKSLQ